MNVASVFAFTPGPIINEANVCLHSCNPIGCKGSSSASIGLKGQMGSDAFTVSIINGGPDLADVAIQLRPGLCVDVPEE